MVITFDNSDSAVQAFELLRVSHYEDKKMLGQYTCLSQFINNVFIGDRESLLSVSMLYKLFMVAEHLNALKSIRGTPLFKVNYI
jgi:hypothetical protein